MQMIISRYTTVKQAKTQFSSAYPNLKIEFYESPHTVRTSSVPSAPVSDEAYLWEVSRNKKEGIMAVSPGMRVSEFEQKMQRLFGLPVQVFRRMGSVWIETIASDDISLEKLNKIVGRSSKLFHFNEHTLFL